jgi:citrate synthase
MWINVRHAMGWLTAAQALDALGVRPQTLYASVSRKRIRAKADPQDPRRSLYHEADVRRLARRRVGPRKVEEVAAGAIEWGDPVLPSAMSTVAAGRLWYRGQDAALLAESKTLEEVAALLWGGDEVTRAPRSPPGDTSGFRESGSSTPLHRAFMSLAERASLDPPSYGRSPSVLREEARGVLLTLAESLLGSGGDVSAPLHLRLATAWQRKGASKILQRTLVLLADHELNASTFAARVAVSTGASLAAGVLAGLATLTGPLHGGAAAGVWELVETARSQGAESAVRDRLGQGRPMAGFGHPLYPAGDPRAVSLLQSLVLPAEYVAVRDAVEHWVGERPNIDFALAAMTRTHRLPKDAPLILFALARCVGWLAHELEQVATGHLIRPRARYVGNALGTSLEAGSTRRSGARPTAP